MMLHDEMVGKLDEPNNDVDANKSLYDKIFGKEEENKKAQPQALDV